VLTVYRVQELSTLTLTFRSTLPITTVSEANVTVSRLLQPTFFVLRWNTGLNSSLPTAGARGGDHPSSLQLGNQERKLYTRAITTSKGPQFNYLVHRAE